MAKRKELYLDDSASTRVSEDVLGAMKPFFLEEYGNPSSLHEEGEKALKAIENVRKQIAKEIGCKASEVYFTSGGTESDNLAILGLAKANLKKKKIIVSSIEHVAVNEVCEYLKKKEGYDVVRIGVDKSGKLNLEELEKAVERDGERILLVSVMHVNNITGVIQDLYRIGKICKKAGVVFHTDAVQSFGKLNIKVKDSGVDLLSASAHKIGGSKGIGFLFVKEGVQMEPIIYGGGQEKGLRSGTENVPGIVGFGKALDVQKRTDKNKINNLKSRLIKGLEKIGGKINSPVDGIFNIVNVTFNGVDGETLVYRLSTRGIYVSAGSACDSKKEREYRVLKAVGLKNNEIMGSIRISLNSNVSGEDIDYVLEEIRKRLERLGQ